MVVETAQGLCRMVSFILNEHGRPHTLWYTHWRRYNATSAINSTPVTLGLTFRKKKPVARNAVDFPVRSPGTARASPRGNTAEPGLVYVRRGARCI